MASHGADGLATRLCLAATHPILDHIGRRAARGDLESKFLQSSSQRKPVTAPAWRASRVRLVIFPAAMTNLMYQKSNPAIIGAETGGRGFRTKGSDSISGISMAVSDAAA